MIRTVAIVVEGQTEAAFINEILGPHLGPQVHLQPIITVTRRTASGGYPKDAPASGCHQLGQDDPDTCVRLRAQAMTADVPGPWLRFLTLHEFETMVIAAGSLQSEVLGDEGAPAKFDRMIREAGGAERINDGQQTAPSKRVSSTLTRYRKAQDAIEVLSRVPLADVLHECPGVERWVGRLRV